MTYETIRLDIADNIDSRANFYHWVHFLSKVVQVDTSVSADTPLYAVFKNGIERTYVIYSTTAQPRKVTFSNGTVVTSRKSGLTVFTRS